MSIRNFLLVLASCGAVLAAVAACEGRLGGGGSDLKPPPDWEPGTPTSGTYRDTSNACASEPLAPEPWKPGTLYVFGQRVTNDGGKVYQMISATTPTGGRSAASGGPAGTGASIADGDLTWTYAMAAATGTVYYVCDCGTGADPNCQVGNDSNNGTDPAHPLLTLSKAKEQFHAMEAGDTVALCRGGVFVQADNVDWGNSKCRVNNNCTLRDYLPAGLPATTALPAIVSGAGIYRGMPFMSGGAGYRFINLRVTTTAGIAYGYGLPNDLTDLTICNNIVERFSQGVQDDCGDALNKGGTTTARTVIIGSQFLRNFGQGVLVGGDGNIIADNYFDGNGSAATLDHSIYLTNHGPQAVATRIAGNEIRNNDPVGGKCSAVSIVAHGRHRNTLIENNLIDNAGAVDGGCWGIQLGPGGHSTYPHFEYFENAVIRNNRMYGVGSVGIGADMCINCMIENNLVVVDSITGSGGTEGIKAPTQSYDELYTDNLRCPPSQNITVRNNTIYYTAGVTSGTHRGITAFDDGSGHSYTNNAIAFSGSGSYFHCLHLQGSSYGAITNNSCFGQSETGNTEPGITVTTAPQFTNPGSGATFDFTPLAGSPLLNAADPAHAPTYDLTGKTRDATPDIGAYER